MENLKRIVRMYPAYDKRDIDPSKNYGVKGVDLLMVVQGERGAVQFRLFTGWFLQETIAWWKSKGLFDEWGPGPMPADLGYHSKQPMYAGHEPIGARKAVYGGAKPFPRYPDNAPVVNFEPTGTFQPCEFVDGGPCYYDGSTSNAQAIFEVLLREGDEGVWRELEKFYKETFGVVD